jgi:hypothetical protein
MRPESEPVATAALIVELPSPLTRVVASLQRILLAALLGVHFTLPHLLVYAAGNELLLDSILPSQVGLLLIALAFADLTWLGAGVLLVGAAVTGFGWMIVYPTHLHSYALANFVVPQLIFAAALIGLRWRGYRGSWHAAASETPPWQISIRLLMAATAAVAITFAAATWMRDVAAIGVAGNNWFATLVTFAADGLSTTLLCFTAIWAAGTRGAAVAKFLVLVGIAAFLVVFQIYAFRMEEFWHLPTFMLTCWILVTGGTLYIWRVCGWRVVSTKK